MNDDISREIYNYYFFKTNMMKINIVTYVFFLLKHIILTQYEQNTVAYYLGIGFITSRKHHLPNYRIGFDNYGIANKVDLDYTHLSICYTISLQHR